MWAYPDCVVSSALYYAKWPDYHELQFIRRQLKSKHVVIDVGANVGHISLLLSDIVDPQNIFAFEPTPTSFRRLVDNWELNGWPTINLFQSAVGRSRGIVRIPDTFSPETRNAVTFVEGPNPTVEVTLKPLDACRSRWKNCRIGLVKIDVEGFEHEVFAGAQQLLEHDRPSLIMFESLSGSVDADIRRILEHARYLVFQLDSEGYADYKNTSAQNLFALPKEYASAHS